MKLFAIASDEPVAFCDNPEQSAVNVVLWALLKELADLGHDIRLQIIYGPTIGASAGAGAGGLSPVPGLPRVQALPPLRTPAGVRPASFAGRVHRRFFSLERFYPALSFRRVVEERIRDFSPDAVVTLWSTEGMAATHGFRGVPRVSYHGDVEPLVQRARVAAGALFDPHPIGPVDRILRQLDLSALDRAHRALMGRMDAIANITAWNAAYYRKQGHPASTYVGNVWVPGPAAAPPAPGGRRRIIGHFGHLNRTGSSFGLRFLTRDVLPALEKELAGVDYEVLVIGGEEAAPGLRDALRHPRIRRVGFVKDPEPMLADADAFMMLNNVGGYVAAYTRHLVAWSRGLCLVTHERSRLAIPEIEPGVNALVGDSGAAVARAVAAAVKDRDLNFLVRRNGRATFERVFTPAMVARRLLTAIETAIAERT